MDQIKKAKAQRKLNMPGMSKATTKASTRISVAKGRLGKMWGLY